MRLAPLVASREAFSGNNGDKCDSMAFSAAQNETSEIAIWEYLGPGLGANVWKFMLFDDSCPSA